MSGRHACVRRVGATKGVTDGFVPTLVFICIFSQGTKYTLQFFPYQSQYGPRVCRYFSFHWIKTSHMKRTWDFLLEQVKKGSSICYVCLWMCLTDGGSLGFIKCPPLSCSRPTHSECVKTPKMSLLLSREAIYILLSWQVIGLRLWDFSTCAQTHLQWPRCGGFI